MLRKQKEKMKREDISLTTKLRDFFPFISVRSIFLYEDVSVLCGVASVQSV